MNDEIEAELTDDELFKMTDIAVRGQIVEKVDEILYKSDEITSIVSIYKFSVLEIYKGNIVNGSEIQISFGGTELPQEIELGEKYLICFKKTH